MVFEITLLRINTHFHHPELDDDPDHGVNAHIDNPWLEEEMKKHNEKIWNDE